MDVDAAGEGGLRPRIALNAEQRPVVLWGDNDPMTNRVAVGNGLSFGAATEVSGPGWAPAVADWMGSSIASMGDTVWVVMKSTPEEQRPVYVRASYDGGASWGDTLRVDPYDGLVSRFPSIAVNEQGEPLVQYMQFDSGYNGARQVMCRWNGAGFDPPVQLSTPFSAGLVCDCCPNQALIDGTRAVGLYRNADQNDRVIWGASSTDGGATFPTGGPLDGTDWIFPSCPSSGPDGILGGNTLITVWMSGAENGTKVYIGSASADDLATAGRATVHGGQLSSLAQNFPRIAGHGDTLGVVWEQSMAGQREILFSWSTTGPDGLSGPDTVNTDLSGAQKTPDIEYRNGVFHIVWSEGAAQQVRYRTATIQETTGMVSHGTRRVSVHPDPAMDRITISGGPWTETTVLDAQGRPAGTLAPSGQCLQVASLAPGPYLLLLRAVDGRMAFARFVKQ